MIGGVDGNWFNASNWSPAQVPTSADNAVIDMSSTVAAGTTSIAFATLTLGDTAGNFSPTLRLSAAEGTSGSVVVDQTYEEAVAEGGKSFKNPSFYPAYVKWFGELRVLLKADPRASQA